MDVKPRNRRLQIRLGRLEFTSPGCRQYGHVMTEMPTLVLTLRIHFLLLPAGFLKRRFSLDLQPISVDVQTGTERRTSHACAQSLPRLLNSSMVIIFLLSSSLWIATPMHERSEKVRGRWKHACTRFSDLHFSKGSTHDSKNCSPTTLVHQRMEFDLKQLPAGT